MNVVSDRFVQWAIDCICSLDSASPSSTTATGLPLNGTAVNTSTCRKANFIVLAPLLPSPRRLQSLLHIGDARLVAFVEGPLLDALAADQSGARQDFEV